MLDEGVVKTAENLFRNAPICERLMRSVAGMLAGAAPLARWLHCTASCLCLQCKQRRKNTPPNPPATSHPHKGSTSEHRMLSYIGLQLMVLGLLLRPLIWGAQKVITQGPECGKAGCREKCGGATHFPPGGSYSPPKRRVWLPLTGDEAPGRSV